MDETGYIMLAGRGVLGDAVGQMYAQRYFSPETKTQIEAMVANIIAAYRRRIDALSWMDPATKAEAQAKLSNLYVGIGYPETWRDYSSYEVKADDISETSGAAACLITTALSPVSAIPSIEESGVACIRKPSMPANCRCKTRSTSPLRISNRRTSIRRLPRR